MKKATLLITAVLVVATTDRVAGIAVVVVPSTIQNAQANPCSAITATTGAATGTPGEGEAESGEVNIKCNSSMT
jgi:hypothetical protein